MNTPLCGWRGLALVRRYGLLRQLLDPGPKIHGGVLGLRGLRLSVLDFRIKGFGVGVL